MGSALIPPELSYIELRVVLEEVESSCQEGTSYGSFGSFL